jgi:hypothetical protein
MASSFSFIDTDSNVTPFVPITLDVAAHNYYNWLHPFEVHLGSSNLRGHVVLDSVHRPNDPQWVKDDLAIIQWIYMQDSTKIFNLVFQDAATAAALWTTLLPDLLGQHQRMRKHTPL